MKSRNKVSIVLYSVAVGFGCSMAAATAVLAQEPAQKPDAAVQKADGAVVQSDGAVPKLEMAKSDAIPSIQRQAELIPNTGSNIRRYRAPDTTLPHVELDRAYIDRSGATNAAELLRTVPQVQVPAK